MSSIILVDCYLHQKYHGRQRQSFYKQICACFFLLSVSQSIKNNIVLVQRERLLASQQNCEKWHFLQYFNKKLKKCLNRSYYNKTNYQMHKNENISLIFTEVWPYTSTDSSPNFPPYLILAPFSASCLKIDLQRVYFCMKFRTGASLINGI